MSVASYIGRGKFNLDLIKEVQKYDALYNSAHPDFRNYAVKTHIWQEISKALGETEQFCKRRWLDLRKQYSKEQQKTQSVRNTFWIYTDALSFLKPYEKPKIEFLPREISKREAYCRTCLSSFQANPFQAPKTFNIFEIKDFAEKLSQCSSRQVVEWDEYPQVVCELCYKKVIYFYQFREMCLSSLEKFNTIIHDPKEVTYDLENTIEKSFNTTDNDSDLSNILDDSIKTEVEHGKPHSSHEIDDKIMDEIIQVEIERSAGADDVKAVEEFEEEKEISADFEYDTMESEKDFSNFESINEESVEHDPDYVVEELETIDYENPLEENTEEWIQQSLSEKSSAIKRSKRIKFKCDICPKTFFTKHCLEAHQRRHQGLSGFACPYENCDRAYNRITDLRRHMDKHEGVKNEFICEVKNCGKIFTEYYALNYHRRKDHNWEKISRSQRWENFENKIDGEETTNPETINKTDATFDEIWDESIENAAMPEYLEDYDDGAKDAEDIPKAIKKEKNFICETCGTACKNGYHLKVHSLIHMDESEWPYVCDKPGCGKKFRERSRLKTHLLRHAGIKKYVCPHCGVRKVTKNELNIHINFHTFEKKYTCRFCNKVFKSVGCVSTHIHKVHEKQYPKQKSQTYECRYCGRKLSSETSRKYHESTHTGEKSHACGECGKKFITRSNLKYHMSTHIEDGKTHACKECDKKFKWPGALFAHMKTHSEATRLKCDQCNRLFNWPSHLEAHKKLHEKGDLPYECDICGKKFRWPASCYVHKKKHLTKGEVVEEDLVVDMEA